MKTKTQEQLEEEIEKKIDLFPSDYEINNQGRLIATFSKVIGNCHLPTRQRAFALLEKQEQITKLSQHKTDIKKFEKLIDKLRLRRRRNWKFGQVVEYGVLWKDVEKIKEALKEL